MVYLKNSSSEMRRDHTVTRTSKEYLPAIPLSHGDRGTYFFEW